MLDLFCDETYSAMTKYDDADDERDNYRNEDGNNNDNATSGSRSNDLIFYLITTPWSRIGLLGDNSDSAAAADHYVSTRQTIYLPYKLHIKDVPYFLFFLNGLRFFIAC